MQTSEQVMYLAVNNIFILKLIGTLRFTNAPFLENALSHVHKNDEVIIDMTETKYVDSTMLGSIVKFFLQGENQQKYAKKRPTIVCQNDDIIQTFSKIGFNTFFNFVNKDERVVQPKERFVKVEEIEQDDEKIKNCVLHAHQTLNKLHPKDSAVKLVLDSFKNK